MKMQETLVSAKGVSFADIFDAPVLYSIKGRQKVRDRAQQSPSERFNGKCDIAASAHCNF